MVMRLFMTTRPVLLEEKEEMSIDHQGSERDSTDDDLFVNNNRMGEDSDSD